MYIKYIYMLKIRVVEQSRWLFWETNEVLTLGYFFITVESLSNDDNLGDNA